MTHQITEHLIPFLWLGWATYWLVGSFSASAPKRAQNPTDRILYRLKMALAAALLIFPELSYGWLSSKIFPWSSALYGAAVVLIACGLGFACWARIHLGTYWSGNVTLKPGHRLIRSGPYAIVRHPIYTGLLIAFTGTALAVDRLVGLLSIALFLYANIPKLRLEERWLTEEFGEEYRRYRREVKALVPFIV